MGVPHLTSHLVTYAESIVFAKGDKTSSVIVDGPGLAYHIYYKCLSLRPTARNALEASSSYQELGHAVIAWLNHLEACGLRIEAIYFDGLLPKAKESTRLARLENYLNQLSSFRSLHNSSLPIVAASVPLEQITAAELFGLGPVSAKLKALPALPFLVPAIIEAVLSSRFESVTSVIPGEADAFVAEYARRNGGIVITSDSDLLVHSLGPHGFVIFFKDLEYASVTTADALKAVQYHPARIAAELGLPNLIRLAYELKKDYHRGFKDSVRRAKDAPDEVAFDDFLVEHSSLLEHSLLAKAAGFQGNPALSEIFSRLDPRISEFVHQHRDICSSGSRRRQDASARPHHYQMYLPFLIDDPTRVSAWRCAASCRRLAYSIMDLPNSQSSVIEEYERRGTRIASTDTSSLTVDEIAQSCKSLVGRIDQWMQRLQHLHTLESWRILGLILCCQSLVADSNVIPTRSEIMQVLTAQRSSWSWAEIHLRAQVEAVLYSLRTLKQILNLYMNLPAESKDSVLQPQLEEVQKRLSAFPGLAELHVHFKDPLANPLFQGENAAIVFETLEVQEELEDNSAPYAEVQGQKKRRRKRRSAGGDSAQKPACPRFSDNKYAALDAA